MATDVCSDGDCMNLLGSYVRQQRGSVTDTGRLLLSAR